MHRGVLCFYSGHFCAQLSGSNDDTDFVKLPNEDATAFRMFYDWVNNGEIVRSDGNDLEFKYLITLYVFAKSYECRQFANMVLDIFLLLMVTKWTVGTATTADIYERTKEDSPLRKLHIDLLFDTFSREDWRALATSLQNSLSSIWCKPLWTKESCWALP
jgi:hypothetical protein